MIDEKSLRSIEELHRLKIEGIITEEDFDKAKARVLFGGVRLAVGTTGPVATPTADDHLGWMVLPLKRYADFQGRASRREFWMFQIIPFSIFLCLTFLIGHVPEYGEISLSDEVGIGVLGIALAGLLIPMLAVEVRRLHDLDKSGWLVLLNLIPYLGSLALYAMALLPATPGGNRFGPEPEPEPER